MSRLIALMMTLAVALSVLGATPGFAQAPKGKAPASEAKSSPKAAQIDINTASAEELQTLKGIGDVYAKKIIENRPYRAKDELVSKNVIPQATYDKVKGQIVAKQAPVKK